jgi:hypothetical protein
VTTVAASTQKREFASTVTLRADSGATLGLGGASITGGVTTFLPLALADDAPYADPRCLTPAAPGTFTGKIVVCERGTNARIAKSWNVAQGGAAGMILYDTDPAENRATDNHTIPSVHLDAAAGDALLTFASLNTGVTARFTPGKPRSTPGDVMAGFSSRGGTDQTLGISKPDITAPGVAILAGHTPEPELPADPPGELFQAIQGTSMSSPHVAGAAALLKDLHPDWTPGQIKSALMTTALTTGLVREDGVSPFTPFDAGSGRVDLRKAGDPGVTFDVPVNDFIVHAADLWNTNYPSIFVPDLAGSTTVQRTARSVLPTTTVWELTVTGPPDLPVSVPAQISVPAGDQTPFTIGIDGTAVPAGQARHATLELRQGARRLHLPITVTGARPRPDLVVTAVSGASTATAGGTIANISVTVRNNGPATAGRFTTHWFFSTDTQFTPDDVQFADCVLLSLGASGEFTCNFTNVAVPSTLAPGIYRLVAIVDIFGQVAESTETNNENFSAGTVTVD